MNNTSIIHVLDKTVKWHPCTVTLRGLVDENHPILLLIYRDIERAMVVCFANTH